MVYYKHARFDVAFTALDAARHHRSAGLPASELAVGPLAAPFTVSLPAVMKHLGVLAAAGMIEREKTGGTAHCRRVAAADGSVILCCAATSPSRPNSSIALPLSFEEEHVSKLKLTLNRHLKAPLAQVFEGRGRTRKHSAVLRTDLRGERRHSLNTPHTWKRNKCHEKILGDLSRDRGGSREVGWKRMGEAARKERQRSGVTAREKWA